MNIHITKTGTSLLIEMVDCVWLYVALKNDYSTKVLKMGYGTIKLQASAGGDQQQKYMYVTHKQMRCTRNSNTIVKLLEIFRYRFES